MAQSQKKENKAQNLPLVSFVTPMKEKDFRVIALLDSIKKQDYPLDKIEVIITDGGSNPEVLKKCRSYPFVSIYHNPKGFAEGAGMGKDQGIWKSRGKYVVIAESDIEFIERDWIRKMILPLEQDNSLFASVPQLYIHPKDSATNKYLSFVGVDPFASYRAFDAQHHLRKKVDRTHKQGYDHISMDKKAPYCMGSNGFMFRKTLVKEVGDYAQDVEFIARIAKKGHLDFAYVPTAHVWHKNVKGFWDFMRKRVKWTRNYTKVYIHEKKDYEWITSKPSFFWYSARNLLVIPNVPIAVHNAIKYREKSWLLHPSFMLISTGLNVFFALTSPKMFSQVFEK